MGIVAHFLRGGSHELHTLLLGLPEIHGHTGEEQARALRLVLNDYGIDKDKLGWFVLDNASNNDTALLELQKAIEFDPQKKGLRCAGHIINLAVYAFLCGKDPASFERQMREEPTIVARLNLWRKRGSLGKLHNLIFHIKRSDQRTNIFKKLQEDNLDLVGDNKIYAPIQDGGVRWNSTYMMIERAIKLKDALDSYYYKMTRSTHEADRNFGLDEITSDDWEMLIKIKSILKPFYVTTKHLEGKEVMVHYGKWLSG